MVMGAKWQHLHVRARIGAPVDVVDADVVVNAAVDSACDASDFRREA